MQNIRPQKLNYMFLRHFFSEKDAGGQLFILIFLPFVNRNDVPTMFRKIPTLSGAESRERVHRNSTNQPSINKANGGQIELIIHYVPTIFHIY